MVMPTLLGSDFTVGVCVNLWGQHDVIMFMVEAGSHLKLLSASILDIYKMFEHINMLSIGIQ